jgi:hypothetical protein
MNQKKSQSWAELTRAMAGGDIPESLKALTGEAKTLKEAITIKLFEMALNGDFQAIKLIQERSEGRPNMATEVEEAFDLGYTA